MSEELAREFVPKYKGLKKPANAPKKTTVTSKQTKRKEPPKEEKRGRKAVHDASKSHLFVKWASIRQKCKRQPEKYKIIDDWHNFAKFREWATENGYTEPLVPKLIDITKPYAPDNVRFVPPRNYPKNRTQRTATSDTELLEKIAEASQQGRKALNELENDNT